MYVLGTAGHVDHGKSSLLRSLTGQEPDRLPEEKKRGMTIDLNFVWMGLPSGERVGIVDVPGHQRFVKNMISGVMTVDAFLFVVAADDGWMPQSEEHLAVLKNLGVRHGIGIVTKVDLVDETRVLAVETELRRKLADALGGAFEIARFSTIRAETLPPLKARVEKLVGELSPPRDLGAPRLWIDRVFLPTGLGVVVTGTLREGSLREGDEVKLYPGEKLAVVKTLQVYRAQAVEAKPVSRVAVQLSRISADDVTRGLLLSRGRKITVPRLVDAQVQWFEPRKSRNLEVSLHVGTAHSRALVIRLGEASGDSAFVRLKLVAPLPLRSGDRFVLRTPGEERTLGAGTVVDPRPLRWHKAARVALEGWNETVAGLIAYSLRKDKVLLLDRLVEESIFSREEIEREATSLGLGRVSDALFVDKATWETVRREVVEKLTRLHQGSRWEVTPAELKVSDPSLLPWLLKDLESTKEVVRAGQGYRLARLAVTLTPEEALKREKLMAALRTGQPLSLRELELQVRGAKDSAWRMVKEGQLVALADEHFLDRAAYDALKQKVHGFLKDKGQATTSELRVFLNASRKNVVLMLEQMDKDRLTYLKDGIRRLLRG